MYVPLRAAYIRIYRRNNPELQPRCDFCDFYDLYVC